MFILFCCCFIIIFCSFFSPGTKNLHSRDDATISERDFRPWIVVVLAVVQRRKQPEKRTRYVAWPGIVVGCLLIHWKTLKVSVLYDIIIGRSIFWTVDLIWFMCLSMLFCFATLVSSKGNLSFGMEQDCTREPKKTCLLKLRDGLRLETNTVAGQQYLLVFGCWLKVIYLKLNEPVGLRPATVKPSLFLLALPSFSRSQEGLIPSIGIYKYWLYNINAVAWSCSVGPTDGKRWTFQTFPSFLRSCKVIMFHMFTPLSPLVFQFSYGTISWANKTKHDLHWKPTSQQQFIAVLTHSSFILLPLEDFPVSVVAASLQQRLETAHASEEDASCQIIQVKDKERWVVGMPWISDSLRNMSM